MRCFMGHHKPPPCLLFATSPQHTRVAVNDHALPCPLLQSDALHGLSVQLDSRKRRLSAPPRRFSNSIPPPFPIVSSFRLSPKSRLGTSNMNDNGIFKSGTTCHIQDRTALVADSTSDFQTFVEVGHKLADAAGAIILQYFRKHFEILDKEDLSPVTIADRSAEQAMRTIISDCFPTHAIFGEEWGLTWPELGTEYVWVLDPIDGTKSFITGKPVFGTLIALVHQGTPILGIIDQPVLKERWVGIKGKKTVLNGQEISTRLCDALHCAYLYTTSPHLFAGDAASAFLRVQSKVKVPLYGCDCYAYGLLAAGHVDLVIESGLKPYDFLALVPVVEGAGGIMTDWNGHCLKWWPSSDGAITGSEVIAAGNAQIHQAALATLAWG